MRSSLWNPSRMGMMVTVSWVFNVGQESAAAVSITVTAVRICGMDAEQSIDGGVPFWRT